MASKGSGEHAGVCGVPVRRHCHPDCHSIESPTISAVRFPWEVQTQFRLRPTHCPRSLSGCIVLSMWSQALFPIGVFASPIDGKYPIRLTMSRWSLEQRESRWQPEGPVRGLPTRSLPVSEARMVHAASASAACLLE
jgi:hypothetical protein